MDHEMKDLMTAFAMGTIGAPPVGESAAETKAGEDGLAVSESVAVYARTARTLEEVDKAHPELGIGAEMTEIIAEIEGNGNVGVALGRIDALFAKARPFIPE